MGRMQRTKGAVWEREVANLLKPIFGDGVGRGIAQTRDGACEAPDVDGVPGWWIETKHGKQVSPAAALKQAVIAEHDFRTGESPEPARRRPVGVVKIDRREPVVVMLLTDWLDMLKALHRRSDPVPSALPPPPDQW